MGQRVQEDFQRQVTLLPPAACALFVERKDLTTKSAKHTKFGKENHNFCSFLRELRALRGETCGSKLRFNYGVRAILSAQRAADR
jgi:hypothetical protein